MSLWMLVPIGRQFRQSRSRQRKLTQYVYYLEFPTKNAKRWLQFSCVPAKSLNLTVFYTFVKSLPQISNLVENSKGERKSRPIKAREGGDSLVQVIQYRVVQGPS